MKNAMNDAMSEERVRNRRGVSKEWVKNQTRNIRGTDEE